MPPPRSEIYPPTPALPVFPTADAPGWRADARHRVRDEVLGSAALFDAERPRRNGEGEEPWKESPY